MKIKMLIQSWKIKAPSIEEYRDEHKINLDQIYLDKCSRKEAYSLRMELLKFALLMISLSTVNVEQECSILTVT